MLKGMKLTLPPSSLSPSSRRLLFLSLHPWGAAGHLALDPHPDQRGPDGAWLPPRLWPHLDVLHQVSGPAPLMGSLMTGPHVPGGAELSRPAWS